MHESLAQLVTENLNVKRWLFKLDDEFDGRGIAYCDVTEHLQCFNWALKESKRYGEKWSKKWAQEAAFIKIHSEIADVLAAHAQPVHTDVYSNWEDFLDSFLSQGKDSQIILNHYKMFLCKSKLRCKDILKCIRCQKCNFLSYLAI